jgi:hypothetical protein
MEEEYINKHQLISIWINQKTEYVFTDKEIKHIKERYSIYIIFVQRMRVYIFEINVQLGLLGILPNYLEEY